MEEGGAEGGVAEGFGASGTEGGESSGEVGEGGGAEGIVAVEPGAEEAGVEAIAGADGVDGVDEDGGDPVALGSVLGALLDEGSAGSALDDDQGDAGGEGVEGCFERGFSGDLLDFIFVGEEQIELVEESGEDAGPVAGGVVVGVEREGEAGLLEVIEEFGKAGVEGGLEEEGGEMEVAGGGEEGEVEVGDGHLGHDAGIGEDVAAVAVGEENGDACAGIDFAGDVGGVDAGLREACDGDVAHLIAADLRGEADAGAEDGEIVGEDGGGAAESEGESGAQQLAVGGHLLGEAIEDEIEVGLAGDGDVERFARGAGEVGIHGKTSYCFVA